MIMPDITVRLHRQHDLDLIHLYRVPGFPFQKKMKEALLSFCNGKAVQIDVPPEEPKRGYVPSCVRIHFSLNAKNPEEKEALSVLNEVKYGYRNSFLKAIFRSCLSYIPVDSFAEGDGLRMKKRSVLEMTVPAAMGIKTPETPLPVQTRPDPPPKPQKVPVPVPVAETITEVSREDTADDKMALFLQMDAMSH